MLDVHARVDQVGEVVLDGELVGRLLNLLVDVACDLERRADGEVGEIVVELTFGERHHLVDLDLDGLERLLLEELGHHGYGAGTLAHVVGHVLVVVVVLVHAQVELVVLVVAVLEYGPQVRILQVVLHPAGRGARHHQHRVLDALALQHALLHPLEELDRLLVEAARSLHEQHRVDLVVDHAQRLLEVVDHNQVDQTRVLEADGVEHDHLAVGEHGEVARAAGRAVGRVERLVVDVVQLAVLVEYAVAQRRLAATGHADQNVASHSQCCRRRAHQRQADGEQSAHLNRIASHIYCFVFFVASKTK